jgi:error-prone DNA polymerase
MPEEPPNPKIRPHPIKRARESMEPTEADRALAVVLSSPLKKHFPVKAWEGGCGYGFAPGPSPAQPVLPDPSQPFRFPPPAEVPHASERRAAMSHGATSSAERRAPRYAELCITSNFSFLRGASHPEEFVEQAAVLEYHAVAITDTNTLAGIVRAHTEAKERKLPLIVGCRLVLTEPQGLQILVYPSSRGAYSWLCQLLTTGKRRAPKGECHLTLDDLADPHPDLLAIVIPPERAGDRRAGASTPRSNATGDQSGARTPRLTEDAVSAPLRTLRDIFGDRLSLAISSRFGPDDDAEFERIIALSRDTDIPLVAINDAHYHIPERRQLQDVLTCIRHGCTIEEAGFRLHANAERHLKPPEEMARLFAAYPEAVERTIEIADRAAAFNLDQLRYEYPVEPCPPGQSPIQYLKDMTWEGAAKRYPDGIPAKTRRQVEEELKLIEELKFEAYFLTCADIVRFARSQGILCQGRGGAANSAVCYCLQITEVDPAKFSLLFARFVSRARGEPPDIDIDFEHERREIVIQYIYDKYGRDRAALTAEVISYRGRSAVRDVGKAMGLSLDTVDAMAKNLGGWHETINEERVQEIGLNPRDPTIRKVLELTSELVGFPRHLSQHVGGFVITRTPLSELVPIENAAMDNRTVIEWDKDDIDAMGMLKVDVLGLGMLTCIRKAFELVKKHRGRDLTIATVPAEDPDVYAMIQKADTIGVFQIESRAQMSMLPRLKPKEFYDLVIEVAIVRPGPIQGKMVHPYLRRRNGEESFMYPSPEIEKVLGRTLGVPLFQEQAMQLAIVAAGFTPDEADQLRRAMAAWKRKGDLIYRFGQKLIGGMMQRGYPREFAERCFEQIKGFSEYGFPESHAASFALLVYVSCWLKHHEPAAFAAALINSQPMGFYQPAQIVRDAKEHGVPIREVDVNCSEWGCTLEEHRASAGCSEPSKTKEHRAEARCHEPSLLSPTGRLTSVRLSEERPAFALRLGMRLTDGLPEDDAKKIRTAVEEHGSFKSIESLWRASGCSVRALNRLANADAFGSMGIDRREALWFVRPLRDDPLPLFEGAPELEEPDAPLPRISPMRQVMQDYHSIGLSLKSHPMSFIRNDLDRQGVTAAVDLRDEREYPNGREVTVAGIVLNRQRPGTASGVVFATLEDETGIANLVIWSSTFEQYRRIVRLSTILLARGKVERKDDVIHLHARHLESLDEQMSELTFASRDFH